jgi:hypothetical protein
VKQGKGKCLCRFPLPSQVKVMNDSRVYEIRVKGLLSDHWSDWFDGLSIHNDSTAQTTLRGPLPDQAALIGLLARIHALNLTLVSVNTLWLEDVSAENS